MYEDKLLTHVCTSGNFQSLVRSGVDSSCFLVCHDEFLFVEHYFNKYGRVPSLDTLLKEFPDFEVPDGDDAEDFLITSVQEDVIATELAPMLKEAARLRRDASSWDAVDYLNSSVDRLRHRFRTVHGCDIVREADSRWADYQKRASAEGLLGISTGVPTFDKLTYGWMPDEFNLIAGILGEGKSFVLLYFLAVAWLLGRKPVLFSLEMNATIVGYRFDAFASALLKSSNPTFEGGKLGDLSLSGMLSGKLSNAKDYEDYLRELREKNPFVVYTSQDNGGKRYTQRTVESILDYEGGDIVGLDQLSLMDDARKGKGPTEQLGNITGDLKVAAEARHTPYLAAIQINRAGMTELTKASGGGKKGKAKAKEAEEHAANNTVPGIEHISTAIKAAQDADKILIIRKNGTLLHASFKKNRNNVTPVDAILVWEIDRGAAYEFTGKNVF